VTTPVVHLSQRPTWYTYADQVPASGVPEHPCLHRDALTAWQHVRTEQIIDQRHLLLADPRSAPELVSYHLIGYSPYWQGWEKTADVGPVWDGPVVYSPSAYAAYGGAGLANFRTAYQAIHCGLGQAESWKARALVLPHLAPGPAQAATGVLTPDADIFTNYAYTTPVHPDGLSGHLSELANRSAARSLSRAYRRGCEAGLKLHVLRDRDLVRELPGFVTLARQFDAKHGTRTYGADVIKALTATPGAVLLAAVHEKRMVGGFLAFAYRGRLYLSTPGIAYDQLAKLHTHEWLMGTAFEYAAAIGAHTLDGGRSNHRTKKRWGFNATELRTLVYLTRPDPAVTTALLRLGDGLAHAATDQALGPHA
jgi:Acetyltransferase (GNAT) domain